MMNCHRLRLAVAVLAAMLLQPVTQALSQTGDVIRRIVVEGNQRIEPSTVESYLALRPGEPFDSQKLDDSLKSLFATGLFDDVTIDQQGDVLVVKVVENPIINRIAFEGNKRLDDQGPGGRDPASAARRLHPRPRAERGQPHPRALSPQRPLRRQGRAQDHRARPEPRRSGVRDQRGPDHRRRRDQLHRQRAVQRQHAARRDPDQGKRLVSLPDAPTTPTIPTGSPSTRSCCAGSILRAAMPISRSSPPSPS